MFNNVRRCLTVSVKFHGKFLVQLIRKDVLLSKLHSHANARCSIVYKRFYCDSTTKKQNVTSSDLRKQQQILDKQKLDELLSDPENKKRFQILELEVDVLRYNADRVPENIEPKDWLMLLNMTSKSKRKKYLDFLWSNEKTLANVKAKKELKRAEWLAKKEAEKEQEQEDTGEIKYGLLNNTLFLRIYDTTINRFYNGRLIQGMMFEPKIVFDCGYDNYMNDREIHNCAKQLSFAFASNRSHANPMSLYFCNFNQDGLLKKHLHQNIPTLLNDDFPVTITSQSYLDIFPKDQLVYLTPHCRTNLHEYDPDMVYIIGALIDLKEPQPLSMAKAKREGIRMAKFPIERYLDWGASSSKTLTLDQSIRIMLDLRHTRDWKVALKNVPVRKLRSSRENMLRKKIGSFSDTYTERSTLSDTQKSKMPLNFTFENRKIN